jgi:hypothetical protein
VTEIRKVGTDKTEQFAALANAALENHTRAQLPKIQLLPVREKLVAVALVEVWAAKMSWGSKTQLTATLDRILQVFPGPFPVKPATKTLLLDLVKLPGLSMGTFANVVDAMGPSSDLGVWEAVEHLLYLQVLTGEDRAKLRLVARCPHTKGQFRFRSFPSLKSTVAIEDKLAARVDGWPAGAAAGAAGGAAAGAAGAAAHATLADICVALSSSTLHTRDPERLNGVGTSVHRALGVVGHPESLTGPIDHHFAFLAAQHAWRAVVNALPDDMDLHRVEAPAYSLDMLDWCTSCGMTDVVVLMKTLLGTRALWQFDDDRYDRITGVMMETLLQATKPRDGSIDYARQLFEIHVRQHESEFKWSLAGSRLQSYMYLTDANARPPDGTPSPMMLLCTHLLQARPSAAAPNFTQFYDAGVISGFFFHFLNYTAYPDFARRPEKQAQLQHALQLLNTALRTGRIAFTPDEMDRVLPCLVLFHQPTMLTGRPLIEFRDRKDVGWPMFMESWQGLDALGGTYLLTRVGYWFALGMTQWTPLHGNLPDVVRDLVSDSAMQDLDMHSRALKTICPRARDMDDFLAMCQKAHMEMLMAQPAGTKKFKRGRDGLGELDAGPGLPGRVVRSGRAYGAEPAPKPGPGPGPAVRLLDGSVRTVIFHAVQATFDQTTSRTALALYCFIVEPGCTTLTALPAPSMAAYESLLAQATSQQGSLCRQAINEEYEQAALTNFLKGKCDLLLAGEFETSDPEKVQLTGFAFTTRAGSSQQYLKLELLCVSQNLRAATSAGRCMVNVLKQFTCPERPFLEAIKLAAVATAVKFYLLNGWLPHPLDVGFNGEAELHMVWQALA